MSKGPYYRAKSPLGGNEYSVRRREPDHPNGFIHLYWEDDANSRKSVKMLNDEWRRDQAKTSQSSG